ncbi:MAG: cobalamin biosynthesis protein CobD [Lachnospiraceae bacterium]|nr:cobalamin biosynthesis protein CobD [Lachnospiraceae bacterium]
MYERILVIGLAFLIDVILGDPNYSWHPIRLIGHLIAGTDKTLRKIFNISEEKEQHKNAKLVAGVALVVIVLAVSLGAAWLLLYVTGRLHRIVGLVVEIILCYQMLAMKSLRDESMKVYYALGEGDLKKARYAVSMIVGRDTEGLDEEGVAKAAVETVAENTSDGVIAPLFYMMIFGALGGVLYKAVNTMDSMVGYKNDRCIYMGRCSAKLDDVVNLIPARLSVIFMLLAGGMLGYKISNGWRIYVRDRYNHASPNSAQTEAVCAGLLEVQLAGNAYYFGKLYEKPTIGDEIRKIDMEHIRVVNRFAYLTALLILLFGLVVLGIIEVIW